jgi:putative endonuclease
MKISALRAWWDRWRCPPAASRSPRAVGRRAEAAAARYLRRQGYDILQQNVELHRGEIDLLARHEGFLVLVEVRSHKAGGLQPREALSRDKQRRLRRLAEQVLKLPAYRRLPIRIDLVEVLTDERDRPVKCEIIKAI